MEGMIFAAGLGTRLRPLTNDRPKAMVELAGKPLLEHVILKMRQAGIGRIVVNVHHFADQIEDFLNKHHYTDQDIIVSDERAGLMDTGGGLWKARSLFTPGEPVLIHNVDIFSDIHLKEVAEWHKNHGDYATLVMRDSTPGRGLRFNDQGLLKGWENNVTGEQKIVDEGFKEAQNYSFCGIHVVSARFLENMVYQGRFSIIDEYLAQARLQPVKMFYYPGFFMDLGTPVAIAEAEMLCTSVS